MDPWQHMQGWTCMCLVVPAVFSPGEELPAKTTAHPAPPCSVAGLSSLGRSTENPSPTLCFCSRNILWDAPGIGPPYGRKTLHSLLHRRTGAQLLSPWAMLAWEIAVIAFVSSFGFCWLWSIPGVMMVEEGTLAWMQNTAKAALSPGGRAEYLSKATQGAGI